MPITRRNQCKGIYNLDSDSDDDLIELHLSRYQEAEYGTALSSRLAYAFTLAVHRITGWCGRIARVQGRL